MWHVQGTFGERKKGRKSIKHSEYIKRKLGQRNCCPGNITDCFGLEDNDAGFKRGQKKY